MKRLPNRRAGTSLLGLSFEGHRLRGAAVRLTDGPIEVVKTFAVTLSLDPLTNDPQLAGREIRQHLDAAGIRERRCAVCIPADWILTLSVRLPDLPEEDLRGFLQLEAERGMPFGLESLILAESRLRTESGEAWATLLAVSSDHASRLEAVLIAAELKPVTFTSGLSALPGTREEPEAGTLALLPAGTSLGLQVACGGGVAALRNIEGIYEIENGAPRLQPDVLNRELRITLGQLPTSVMEGVRRVRVFGSDDAAEELFEEMQVRASTWGLSVEWVREMPAGVFPVSLPPGTPVSPALSLAVRQLVGRHPGFEFLPPKIDRWEALMARYSSRKLAWTAMAAGGVAVLLAAAFGIQQVRLWHWGSQWGAIARPVGELESLQQEIRRYRPWYDESMRSLNVLLRLTESFPEDGSVAAKSVELRGPAAVVCSGTARDRESLLLALSRLSSVPEVADLKTEQMRGVSPVEFTFNFQWADRGPR